MRINALCAQIEPCQVFADVGCDHGKVCEYVLKNKLCGSAVASDISCGALEKAQKILAGYSNVKCVCCDGICYYCDQAVIAGMGADTIVSILKNAVCRPDRLILSPQTRPYILRRYLVQNGYEIVSDTVIFDKKYYTVITAQTGAAQTLDEMQTLFGVFYKTADKTLKEMLLKRLEVIRGYKQTSKIQKEVKLIEEALSWQQ